MVILEPDGFSANNTIVERVTSNGTVLKRVTPNGGTGFSLEKLSELAAEYMSVLREAGIPIPKVQSVNISTESID